MFSRKISSLAMLMMLFAVGCTPQSVAPRPSVEATKPKPAEPQIEPEAPKAIVVKADEFPNIAAALVELKRATNLPPGAEQNGAIQRCEKWLQMQGDKPVAELAALTLDKSQSLELRMTTCRLLGQYSPAAVKPLCEIAQSDTDKLLRFRAMDRLAKLKPIPPEAVNLFIALFDSTDNDILTQALLHLAKIGEPAAEAAEKLQALRLHHSNETVRTAAGDALKKVAPRRTFKE